MALRLVLGSTWLLQDWWNLVAEKASHDAISRRLRMVFYKRGIVSAIIPSVKLHDSALAYRINYIALY